MSKLAINKGLFKKNKLKLFAIVGSFIVASSVAGCKTTNKTTKVEELREIVDEIPANTLEKEVADYILVYDELEKRGYVGSTDNKEENLLTSEDIALLLEQSETLYSEKTNKILSDQSGLVSDYLNNSNQKIYNNYKAELKEYAVEKLGLVDVNSITFTRSYEGADIGYVYRYEAKTSTNTILGEINNADLIAKIDDMIKYSESQNNIENLAGMIIEEKNMNGLKQITLQ